MYITLDRLEGKGLLRSRLGDPTPQRGGRPKRYYQATAAGTRAARDECQAMRRLWDGLDIVRDES